MQAFLALHQGSSCFHPKPGSPLKPRSENSLVWHREDPRVYRGIAEVRKERSRCKSIRCYHWSANESCCCLQLLAGRLVLQVAVVKVLGKVRIAKMGRFLHWCTENLILIILRRVPLLSFVNPGLSSLHWGHFLILFLFCISTVKSDFESRVWILFIVYIFSIYTFPYFKICQQIKIYLNI